MAGQGCTIAVLQFGWLSVSYGAYGLLHNSRHRDTTIKQDSKCQITFVVHTIQLSHTLRAHSVQILQLYTLNGLYFD